MSFYPPSSTSPSPPPPSLPVSQNSSMTTPSPLPTLVPSPASAAHKHNVATFAGAVAGSVGFLALLSLGLCISIKRRRYHSMNRERRVAAGYAEPFTENDHGVVEAAPNTADDDDEEDVWTGMVSPGIRRPRRGPMMREAVPTTFVPRYFPGTLPVSPPPYPAGGPSIVRGHTPPPPPLDGSDEDLSASSLASVAPVIVSKLPLAVHPSGRINIEYPESTSLHRTETGTYSYADRPPPTPPSDKAPPPSFGAIPPLPTIPSLPSIRTSVPPSPEETSPTSPLMSPRIRRVPVPVDPVLSTILNAVENNNNEARRAARREEGRDIESPTKTTFEFMEEANSRSESWRMVDSEEGEETGESAQPSRASPSIGSERISRTSLTSLSASSTAPSSPPSSFPSPEPGKEPLALSLRRRRSARNITDDSPDIRR
ncbi:hypothetical protein BD410DRAFT_836047 [Rickenella mellea]|uniref:Uncharacterized protein n=1 Tax=Rickenella mellea TaxID=50990 RepID=A0A4Y7QIL8_9AGAM|nr:hypothetical protein BD410DRAFT_836047 [Rickenella mellea]